MVSYSMFLEITLHLTPFKMFLVLVILSNSFVNTNNLALPGCPEKCGNLSIPFPFGTTSGCYSGDSFRIICNSSFNPPKPFLQLGSAEVVSISLDGKIKILNSSLELMGLEERDRESVPMVIDWAAGDVACHVAQKDKSRYACQSLHSQCKDSSVGRGHICHCLPGYQGNPYLVDGCQDIDECAMSKPCKGVCTNVPGSFKCYCPKGFLGDGRKDGAGCHPKDQVNWSGSVYFPIGIFVLAPVLASTLTVWICKKKKLQRERLFEQNGGNLLKHKTKLRIYTAEEMRATTNNYRDSNVMQGCTPGTFYRGTLADDNNTEVVVVEIKRVPESQVKRFIDELIFLSRDHSNLMKIMGCCLETSSPLLVYKLHGDGHRNLSRCLHDEALVSWEMRVKVAAEAARGLANLQSQNSRATHGNICSANILFDDSYDVKIFYAAGSSLIPQDSSSSEQENSYKDPEFIRSGQLNKKSDVYSFGVVLTELTGGETFSPKGLISRPDTPVKEVALLAKRCLSIKRGDRPKIEEVEAKLRKVVQLT